MGRERKLRQPPDAVPTGVLTRYQFVRELWAGTRRVLVDPMLVEHAERLRKSEAASLLDELLEPDRRRSRVDLLVPGAEALAQLRSAKWQFASVDLRTWLDDLPGLFRQLAELLSEGRTLVLHGPATLDLDELFALLEEHVSPQPGQARVYGLATWRGSAVLDCGAVVGDEDERDFGITFDNSLGEEVEFAEYLAVFTPGRTHVTEAMTLVELPTVKPVAGPAKQLETGNRKPQAAPKPTPQPRAVAPADSNRAEQLRRQNQLLASARQHALEQLDEVNKRNRDLVRQVEELQRQVARMAAESVARTEPQLTPAEDLSKAPDDGLRARLQAAIWQIEQLEAEVADLRQRPPDELEAELEVLRHKLSG